MQLGEKLFELRKKYGYSQEELADILNVTRQTVSKWENEQTTPELDKAVQLSKLYGISVDELVNNVTVSTETEPTNCNAGFQNEYCERCNEEKFNCHRYGRNYEYEFKSKTTVFGLPLVHINIGRPTMQNKRIAKGVFAIGNIAVGVFALGLLSFGIFAIGLLSLGLVAMAALGIGGFVIGGFAIGIFAIGGITIGLYGIGGIVVAQYGVGGVVTASRVGIGGVVRSFIAIGGDVSGAHTIDINEFTGSIFAEITPWLDNAEFTVSNFARNFIKFFINFS